MNTGALDFIVFVTGSPFDKMLTQQLQFTQQPNTHIC